MPERVRRSLARFSENNKAFKPDINKRTLSAQITALKIIDIEQFLDPEAEFCQDNLSNWLNRVIQMRFDLKILLGVTINPERATAIAVAQRILKKLGLKLEFKFWRGARAHKQRIYSGCQLNPDRRSEVFDYWRSLEVQKTMDAAA